MNNLASQLQTALSTWPQWDLALQQAPTLIDQLDGGLSHSTYLLDAQGQRLVLRLEDPQSRALAMSREWELKAMQAASGVAAGSLAPAIVWSDASTLVTEFIHGRTWTPMTDVTGLCHALVSLHTLPLTLPPFNLLSHCDEYWRNIQSHRPPKPQQTDLFLRCRQRLESSLARHPDQCLCHNDLNPANILYHDRGFCFIDWEYACSNSPYFELATLVEFYSLSDEQGLQLSETYWRLNSHHSIDRDHALREFQLIVRLVEWLWLSLKQPHLRQACEQRLSHLLQH